eukprot:2158092-Lingulodinium_polyedra.AAC.1
MRPNAQCAAATLHIWRARIKRANCGNCTMRARQMCNAETAHCALELAMNETTTQWRVRVRVAPL